MKRISFSEVYQQEVLGIKNYLCPESVHKFRSLKGGLPCQVLAVVFQKLSPSQSVLLKKIMNSIGVLEYSVLEVKDSIILDDLLFGDRIANQVCLFGGPDLVHKGLLSEEDALFVLPQEESSFPKTEQDHKGRNSSETPEGQNQRSEIKKRPSRYFLQVCALEELSGESREVLDRKRLVWKQLQKWRKLKKFKV